MSHPRLSRCLLQVDAIRQGTDFVLACRAAKRYDEPALDACAKLLKVVPEVGGCGSVEDSVPDHQRMPSGQAHTAFAYRTPPLSALACVNDGGDIPLLLYR